MPTPSCRGFGRRDRRVVLPRGLADRGTYDELEYLILADPDAVAAAMSSSVT